IHALRKEGGVLRRSRPATFNANAQRHVRPVGSTARCFLVEIISLQLRRSRRRVRGKAMRRHHCYATAAKHLLPILEFLVPLDDISGTAEFRAGGWLRI